MSSDSRRHEAALQGLLFFFNKGIDPIYEGFALGPNHLPKSLSLNLSRWGLDYSVCILLVVGGEYIQFISVEIVVPTV